MMPSYNEFKKQALENEQALTGESGLNPDSISAFQHREGAKALTPEEIAHQRLINDAAAEGFKEGLAGALAGDGYRAVARGALETGADIIDDYRKAPGDILASPVMLAGKLHSWRTGNKSVENRIRNVRDNLNNLATFPLLLITGGMRYLAKSKSLDPKFLTQEAYDASKMAGSGAAYAADLALLSKAAPTKLKQFMEVASAPVVADALGKGGVSVGDAVADDYHEARRAQGRRDFAIDYFKKHFMPPPGPVIAWEPHAKDTMLNQVVLHDVAKDPEGQRLLEQLDTYKENLDYMRTMKALKQFGKQMAGASIGGVAGLTAAHQITKRIPYLKKKKLLRYLLNAGAAGGLGYAGWKLGQKV